MSDVWTYCSESAPAVFSKTTVFPHDPFLHQLSGYTSVFWDDGLTASFQELDQLPQSSSQSACLSLCLWGRRRWREETNSWGASITRDWTKNWIKINNLSFSKLHFEQNTTCRPLKGLVCNIVHCSVFSSGLYGLTLWVSDGCGRPAENISTFDNPAIAPNKPFWNKCDCSGEIPFGRRGGVVRKRLIIQNTSNHFGVPQSQNSGAKFIWSFIVASVYRLLREMSGTRAAKSAAISTSLVRSR